MTLSEEHESVDFDTRLDEADDLKSEPDHHHPRDSREGRENVRGNDDREVDDLAGRFELSDGEGDDEYRKKGVSARVLYIHGVREVAEKALHDRFSKHGTITALHIPVRLGTSISKGFAFIRMSKPEEADVAIEAENGKTFLGVTIEVMKAKRPRLGAPNSPPRRRYPGGTGGGDSGYGRGYDRFERGDRYPPRRDYYPPRREYSPGPPPTRMGGSGRSAYPPVSAPPRDYYPPAPVDRHQYNDRFGRDYPPQQPYNYPPRHQPYSDYERGRPVPPPMGRPYPSPASVERGYGAPPPAGPNYYPAPSGGNNVPPPPPRRYNDDYRGYDRHPNVGHGRGAPPPPPSSGNRPRY